MPCVFPILSLKVLSFATGDPATHRRHGLAYLLGVVSSFLLIASLLISLQAAGRWVGWGFQLQSTGFVIALAYLFAVMGLSLSGLVLFGGRWMNVGSGLTTAPGIQGSFFTGVLAVIVASPCTAPFMGSALGFALTQPPLYALTVFAALGTGMAAPMVALSSSDRARRWLPKPGAWMETLKQIMAFPLYLTAVWLLWVAGKQNGVDTMAAAAAGLVMLALGLTLLRGSRIARAIGVACLISAIMLGGVRGEPSDASTATAREGTVTWSPDALASLRAKGRPVFVDVTADWCITCLANEQAVLFTGEMTRAFAASEVTYMVADWTNYDPGIGEFVRQHGRNGIPLYVMYSGDPKAPPVILPQLLTTRIMMEALDAVTR
jgi:thiol:disulfide interchange protein DsbD